MEWKKDTERRVIIQLKVKTIQITSCLVAFHRLNWIGFVLSFPARIGFQLEVFLDWICCFELHWLTHVKWKRAWRIKTRKHESKLSYTLYLISTCFFMCKMKLDLQYEPLFLVLFVNMIEEILRKEMGNFTMKFLSLSWQASICLANLPSCSFILSFFLLFSLFWRK